MDYQLRPAIPDDDSFLEQLYADVHMAEFAPLGLPVTALEQLMQMQHRAQCAGYRAQFPRAENSIVWAGPYRIGRLLVEESEGEIRLIDVALLGAFRNLGVGTGLIEELKQRAEARKFPLRLSVRAGNPAGRLYSRLGFVGVQGDATDSAMEWNGSEMAAATRSSDDGDDGTVDVEPDTTFAYFRSVKGKVFVARDERGNETELALVAVDRLGNAPIPGVDPGDSFALTFEGDEGSPLSQGTHALDVGGGAWLEVFLVPVSRSGSKLYYESVFNRASPAG
jgi:ribosomal protein S18 acetylase RimI-like enzyme